MTKGKTSNGDNNNSGMSMLLVLFPQDNSSTTTTTTTTTPSPSKSLISKTQSTISICALLLFTTLLLFTLSTLPNTPPSSSPPRFLLHNHNPTHHHHHFALQRMGTLYRRGTRPMTDLIICHVADETPRDDFRFFLRLLHRSSLTASTDVVFIFSSPSSTSTFSPIILQENDAFSSLIHSNHSNNNNNNNNTFNRSRFFSFKGTQSGEPLWGNKIRTDNNFTTRVSLSYGSVLSFDATELDSENSLAGFLDRVPLSLRRWACYPMLLGRVRHNFKHVMLVDVKSVLILRDPLGRVRNRSADSVLLFEKHGKKAHSNNQRAVLPAVVMGGARGVRRLSNAVVVEIVRAAIQHKKKRNSVSDSAVLSQLASNEFMLRSKNVRLILSTESIPEASSLAGRDSGSSSSFADYAIIQRGTNNHDLNYFIKKQICSSVVDSSVYRDC